MSYNRFAEVRRAIADVAAGFAMHPSVLSFRLAAADPQHDAAAWRAQRSRLRLALFNV